MPCSCFRPLTEEELEARQHTRLIDKELKEDKSRLRSEVKLLLLGAGASGKSTFVRQMRVIHGTGFSTEERTYMRDIIFDNVLSCAKSLAMAMNTLSLSYESEDKRILGDRLSNVTGERVLTPAEFSEIAQWVLEFWSDGGVQACYERRTEFDLLDSCSYYMSHVNRLAAANYVPSEEDIIRCRSPTLSILEYPFVLDNLTYRIVDVGGQRTERRKWMFCFDGVTSVIFLAALSEYTHLGEEREVGNALVESQMLLSAVMRTPFLFKASFILFLNKSDIFEERIQRFNLSDYFPSYTGPACDADAAYEFLEAFFLNCVPEERVQLKQKRQQKSRSVVKEEPLIYCHRTTATDTENIRRIFNAVRDTILENILKDINIV